MYMIEELKTMLEEFRQRESESELLEFKEAKNDYSFENLGKYFSALSNEANLKGNTSAWMIFGVKDKLPREIVGSNYRNDRASLESLKHEVAVQTNGISFQEIYEIDLPEGRVIMFQIPAAPAGIPTSWKGHFYGRDGESLGALSVQELDTIRNQATEVDWSAIVCENATVNDLDEQAIQIAREKFASKYEASQFQDEIEKWDTETFLDKAKLTRNGKITRTAIILLGKAEAAHHVNPHPAQITWKLQTEEEAYQHFGPPFLLSVERVFEKIRNIKFKLQPFNQLLPIELTKYEPKIILEAMNNCIAHQDYTQSARIVVTERVDRITLSNNGNFFDGTIEDYVLHERTPERYRNQFLTQAMVNLDMIDTMGMGIRRMFIEQRKRYFPLPEYDLSDPNRVQMTIYGKLIDENYSRVLIEKADLELSAVINLDKVQKKQNISKEAVAQLRKEKLVEGRYPNIFVSANIAKVTKTQADYTKHKAFDKQYYKDLILSFLKQHSSASPEDFQRLLVDKLSDLLTEKQKKDKIRSILYEMSHKDKSIKNVGKRGLQAKWKLI